MGRESATPAVARKDLLPVKRLLVTPKQVERRAGLFLPVKLVIHMPFPPRRVASQHIEFKRRRPTESAATRHKKRFVAFLRHNGKMAAPILSGGKRWPERKTFPAASHREFAVFRRADAYSDFFWD